MERLGMPAALRHAAAGCRMPNPGRRRTGPEADPRGGGGAVGMDREESGAIRAASRFQFRPPSMWAAPRAPWRPYVHVEHYHRPQARLNEAAGAADATRGGQGSGHGWGGVF